MKTWGWRLAAMVSAGAAVPALALAVARLPSQAPPWLQFRLNTQHAAVLDGTLVANWRIQTSGAFSASPTIAGQTLYIGNNTGTLYAINVNNGSILWSRHVESSLMSNPLLWRDKVIVGEGDQRSYDQPNRSVVIGEGENALLAYDAKTGEERWRLPLEGSGMPTPAIVDGMLVHHDGFGSFVGVDPDTGALRYKRDLESVASMSASLPVGDGRIVTAGAQNNTVWQLRATDGSTIWSQTFAAAASGVGDCPPATDGTSIYCDYVVSNHRGAPREGDDVVEHAYALDLQTGRPQWDVALEDGTLPKGNEAAIPLVAGRMLFFGSAVAPVMHAVDTGTGRVVWTLHADGPIKDGPVERDGTLYFGDLAGSLWAVEAASGQVIGVKRTGATFNVGSPVIAGKSLFIGTASGELIALPLAYIRAARDR